MRKRGLCSHGKIVSIDQRPRTSEVLCDYHSSSYEHGSVNLVLLVRFTISMK